WQTASCMDTRVPLQRSGLAARCGPFVQPPASPPSLSPFLICRMLRCALGYCLYPLVSTKKEAMPTVRKLAPEEVQAIHTKGKGPRKLTEEQYDGFLSEFESGDYGEVE